MIKNLILLVILGVVGYFAYQYFIGSPSHDSSVSRSAFNMSSLPEKCQIAGESMKNAFYRHKKGELVTGQVNGYKSHFRGCLRRAGYTPSEVEAAYKGIADSANYNR